ncbi:MAG: hypothetical protein HY738_19120 [Bacteroidia bacterium]|nr:hypothetical protein [Bacteroidia bacterium]
MTKEEFKKKLSKSLFWEFDFKKLDPDKNRRLFMERIITRGNLEQFIAMMKYYDEEIIKNEVVKLRGLRKINANFLHIIFNIPKKLFPCYSRKRSINQFWI